MKSTSSSPEKLVSKTSFACPVSVISSVYSLKKDELEFLEAAKNNDLETVNNFIEERKKESKKGEFRLIFLADTAAILSIREGNRDVTKLLLSKGFILREPHSRSCQCKECCSLGVLLKALSRLNTYQAMSNPTYLSYCFLYANPPEYSEVSSEDVDTLRSKFDPIYRAFELNGKLEQLAVAEYEFKKEYRALSNQCEEYAVQLLNLCQNMKEIACVMSMTDGREQRWVEEGAADLSVLNFAIKNKNERVSCSSRGSYYMKRDGPVYQDDFSFLCKQNRKNPVSYIQNLRISYLWNINTLILPHTKRQRRIKEN